MPDQLSTLYSDLLSGSYDCVDRVVLDAYFGMGQTGGGLRVWWRELYGSDANLDDNHLMRMAGRFSRRLRAWAKENKVPVVYCSPGEDKHKMAAQHLPTHETKTGLFLVLVSKAPALVWEAQMTGTCKLGQLKPKDPWPYVNHYSFHILDPDWGHLTIKMSGHPPFGAQVILNGHEYVACQAQNAGVDFTKQDNCFTTITNAAELAQVADTLSQNETAGVCASSASAGFIPPAFALRWIWRSRSGAPFITNTRSTRWNTAATCSSGPAARWIRYSRR